MPVKSIEGVPYYRFRVRYRLADGRHRVMTRLSPGYPWVREEVCRELVERFGLEGVKAGSVSIEEVQS